MTLSAMAPPVVGMVVTGVVAVVDRASVAPPASAGARVVVLVQQE